MLIFKCEYYEIGGDIIYMIIL